MEGVKSWPTHHDVILIFDEVSCGWRLAIGGVQEYVGVTPDMTVVAKAMSNGYAMGAVVGSAAVMEPAGRMFISSSYWSDNIGLAAALTTIRELKRREAQRRFREIGEALRTPSTAHRRRRPAGRVHGPLRQSGGSHFEIPNGTHAQRWPRSLSRRWRGVGYTV